MVLKLDIRQYQQSWVVFSLSWGEGQYLSAELPYPVLLCERYREWQLAYLNFYRRLTSEPFIRPDGLSTDTELRGRVAESGSFSATEDWRSQLVQAEAYLLAEFHRWLNSAQLMDVRRQIVQRASQVSQTASNSLYLDLFLSCNASELERLPWEVWEVGSEFAATTAIRVVRAPKTIRSAVYPNRLHRRKPRILAILGDETGLNFQSDRQAVQSLARLTEIQFVGWQPGQDLKTLPNRIAAAIADPRGWDILFFAGHGNETTLTGGSLAVGPGVSISINEIMPQLRAACDRGLQFALFNSCNGLSIAETLISLGFSQVAVMREPIHNQVAQEFLIQFLRSLAARKDVHESLTAARQFLKVEKQLTYPSAHLVPSLFCHPTAELFRLQPTDLKSQLQPWLPTRTQAVSLLVLGLLSLLLPVQGMLLEQRIWLQAIYRRSTGQGIAPTSPPVALVQIDNQSLKAAGISQPNPMDRGYLAQLVNRLASLKAGVIGIDYLLDRPAVQPEKDQQLAQAIQSAIRQPSPTWFVFVDMLENGEWVRLLPNLANPDWSLIGDMHLLAIGDTPSHIKVIPTNKFNQSKISDAEPLPFSFLLASVQQFRTQSNPSASNFEQFPNRPLNHILEHSTARISPRAQLQPVTAFSYWLKQMWLHPIIDFSIPPDQVYRPIPAWQLLQLSPDSVSNISSDSSLYSSSDSSSNSSLTNSLEQQVVIIAAGGYSEAGIFAGQDSYRLPAAVRHWRFWQSRHSEGLDTITGGEIHAYMVQAFLQNRLVVPVPDLWMIGLAALLGKGLTLRRFDRLNWRWLVGGTTAYGLLSLQIYISAAILLPILLPVLTFWTYTLPNLKPKSHA